MPSPLYPKEIAWYHHFGDMFFSLVRVLVKSRWRRPQPVSRLHDDCLILGTGPSLPAQLEHNADRLASCDMLAVNHFAQSDLFARLQPRMYLVCDPAFMVPERHPQAEATVRRTYDALQHTVSWPMSLFVPYAMQGAPLLDTLLNANPNVQAVWFNPTRVDGWQRLAHRFYDRQLGMPRPQNVLLASLMMAIHAGYRCIWLAGADNDWLAHLWVDADNRLRQDDFHFYKEGKEVQARYCTDGLVEWLTFLYYVFDGYRKIAVYARRCGTDIRNLCLTSYIDAFPKQTDITPCDSPCANS